jgi:hypothetical protein
VLFTGFRLMAPPRTEGSAQAALAVPAAEKGRCRAVSSVLSCAAGAALICRALSTRGCFLDGSCFLKLMAYSLEATSPNTGAATEAPYMCAACGLFLMVTMQE